MRVALTAACCLAVAACGGPETNNAAVTASQIERVSTPRVVVEDPLATVRLQPLTSEDLLGASVTSGCRFNRNDQVLLAASGNNAVARIGGALRHFAQTAPVGPTGGFFQDGLIGISVGRGEGAGAPARIAVTNRRTGVQREWQGEWVCGQ